MILEFSVSLVNTSYKRFCLSGLEIVPSYMIKDKKEVGEGHKAQWTKKFNLPEVTKSWHDYQVMIKNQIYIIYIYVIR